MFADRPTRFEDLLFVALILLPTTFALARYIESKAEMEQIALHNGLTTVILAKAPTSNPWAGANSSIVHRF